MAGESRAAIQAYIAGDTPSVAPPGEGVTLPREVAALRRSVRDLASADDAPMPAPDANPDQFQAAIKQREASVRKKDKEGRDIPRKGESSPWLRPVYKVHDALIKLPTPGGAGLLVLAILVLFLILIPATSAGETRALLFWEVILGKKRVYDPDAPQLTAIDAGSGQPPGDPAVTSTHTMVAGDPCAGTGTAYDAQGHQLICSAGKWVMLEG